MYGEHSIERGKADLLFGALAQAADELKREARYSEEYLGIGADAIGQPGEDLRGMPLYTWYSDLDRFLIRQP